MFTALSHSTHLYNPASTLASPQWARDQFEGWFKNAPSEVNNYLTDANYLVELAKQPNVQLETLHGLRASLVDEVMPCAVVVMVLSHRKRER